MADATSEVNLEHAQLDEVTGAELAVDRDVEHCEVADVAIVLEPGPDDAPDASHPWAKSEHGLAKVQQ